MSRVVKFIETGSRMVVSRGWGRKWGIVVCLRGIEFQFCKMKTFWKVVSNSVNTLNATELRKGKDRKCYITCILSQLKHAPCWESSDRRKGERDRMEEPAGDRTAAT